MELNRYTWARYSTWHMRKRGTKRRSANVKPVNPHGAFEHMDDSFRAWVVDAENAGTQLLPRRVIPHFPSERQVAT